MGSEDGEVKREKSEVKDESGEGCTRPLEIVVKGKGCWSRRA